MKQLSLFDDETESIEIDEKLSQCKYMGKASFEELKEYFDLLNEDVSHMSSRDDICTPFDCVKRMIDYVPEEFWQRKSIKVIDPCCGNGNFGAYISLKTNPNNIFYNDLNLIRLQNCKKILNPKHIACSNAFELSGDFDRKYDLVVANPPYSGGGNKNRSLSNDFIELAIDLLNDKGYLCYITPNNWMTYNNNNTTLKKLLTLGSFVVIDCNAKQYFPKVGSSFVIIVWQKNVFDNKTKIVNAFLKKDTQENVVIPSTLPFIPLYISQNIINVICKAISKEETGFAYRCDLHHFTQKRFLSDVQNEEYPYETIHTARSTCYASKKQDIYNKWVIIIPLSTYFVPYIRHNVNTTQSVGYYAFNTEKQAETFIKKLQRDYVKTIVHITRYGNFNNIMVLKHIIINEKIEFTAEEQQEISQLASLIKY